MRITKELVGVGGTGLQKILNYQRCINEKKMDLKGTKRAFEDVKVCLLNDEYEKAEKVLESIYMERIPKDFKNKISQFNKREIKQMCDKWNKDFIKMGEQGFISLVYLRLEGVMCNDRRNKRRY